MTFSKRIAEIERDLEATLAEVPAGSKASLVKAIADLAALSGLREGLESLDPVLARLGLLRPGTALGDVIALVLRGVSTPRALRLARLEVGRLTPAELEALRLAEDARAATAEIGLMARALLDTSSAGLAALKEWRENAEELTAERGAAEPTVLDLVLDAPELRELVVKRYGHALPHDPKATA